MRIAFMVNTFPALSETFVLNQVTGLLDRGHEVDIFASSARHDPKVHPDVEKYDLLERTYYRNIHTSRIKRVLKAVPLVLTNFHKNPGTMLKALNVFKHGKKALSMQLLYYSLPFLDKKEYDIIYCHFGPNGKWGTLLKDVGAVDGKLLTVFHGADMSTYIEQNGRNVYDNLFKKGDLFLPISERWKKKLINMGCPEDKTIVHRMGIDPGKFQFSTRQKNGDVQLLSIGRFVEKKGLKYAIQASAKILKKHDDVDYQIAGGGPLREEIEHLIEKLGVKNRITLLGWQQREEVAQLMKDSDILIAPSVTSKEGDQEGIPVTLMEALAKGLPVIATQHSGISELIQDGESGFLVPERDVDALADKLQYLVDHPEDWPKMGQAGREYVEENYDINKLNDRLVEIYEGVVNGNLS